MIPSLSEPSCDLGLGEDHPVRLDAAQLRLAEPRAVRQHGAGQRDHHGLAGGHVGRAAHDRALVRPAQAHGAHAQPVRVGMLARRRAPRRCGTGRRCRRRAGRPRSRRARPRCRSAPAWSRAGPRPARGRSTPSATRRGPASELLQEAQVVLEQQAQVGHAVLEHRHAVDAEAEREALHVLRVVAVLLARTRTRSGRPCRRRRPRSSPFPCTAGRARRRAAVPSRRTRSTTRRTRRSAR